MSPSLPTPDVCSFLSHPSHPDLPASYLAGGGQPAAGPSPLAFPHAPSGVPTRSPCWTSWPLNAGAVDAWPLCRAGHSLGRSHCGEGGAGRAVPRGRWCGKELKQSAGICLLSLQCAAQVPWPWLPNLEPALSPQWLPTLLPMVPDQPSAPHLADSHGHFSFPSVPRLLLHPGPIA